MLVLEPVTLVVAVLVPVSVSLSFLGCAISVLQGRECSGRKARLTFSVRLKQFL